MGSQGFKSPALPGPLVVVPLNRFLLEQGFEEIEWSAQDLRTTHLKKTLKAKEGDQVDFGVINGTKGKGRVSWQSSGGVRIKLSWQEDHPPDLIPISILVGLSRPQTCRKIIEQGAALGLKEIIFFSAEKSEPSYANSSLWGGEWRRLLIKGTEQAFSCHLPNFQKLNSLEEAIQTRGSNRPIVRLALDNYEARGPLPQDPFYGEHTIQLAIGPERGWAAKERDFLRQNGFELSHLGKRILRVETAMVAAVGYLSGKYWANL